MQTTVTRLVGVYALAALLIAGIYSCKGEQGSVGPQGAAGPAGAAGATGPQGVSGATGITGPQGTSGAAGKDGNANVVYSDWKVVPTDGGYYRAADNLLVQFNALSTAHPMLTKDAIDKGLIYVYYKVNALQYDQTTADYKLVERISQGPGPAFTSVKIPGRTTNTPNDYYSFGVGNDLLGENYFGPYVYSYTQVYDGAKNAYSPITESVGKNATYFRDLIKTMPQYRMMVVYGSTKGGRLSNGTTVDYGNYAAVKDYFNLHD